MTDPAAILRARLDELQKADEMIARLAGTVRTAEEGIPARARSVIEAIAAREKIAAAVLDAIALDDQALNARMAAGVVRAGDAPELTDCLLRRDQGIETLARLIETKTREFARLARTLDAQW